MAAQKLADYLWLANILYLDWHNDGNGLTLKEISEKWERETGDNNYDRSKFNRQRSSLSDIFDIDIEHTLISGEYRYSIADIRAIDENPLKVWLINSFATADMLIHFKDIKDRILLEEIPSGQDYLVTILNAITNNHRIWFHHASFWGKSGDVTLSPFCVKLFKKRWYVVGRKDSETFYRVYALDRVDSLIETKENFEMPADFNPQEYFSNNYGIYKDDRTLPVTVRIKVTENQQAYLRSLPLHHSQVEVETKTDYSIFEYKLCPEIDLDREILGRGKAFEVLEPAEYRKHIAEEVKLCLKHYE